jgi:ribonuclease HI
MATLHCFTDGSCFRNGHPNAVAAWSCIWPDYPSHDKAAKLSMGEVHTNNRAEYTGCLNALRTAAFIDPSYKLQLVVHTDSMLLINSMTKWIKGWKKNGWKTKTQEPVKNIDLLKQLDAELFLRQLVKFEYVKAHTGGKDWSSIYNDKADRAAKEACSSRENEKQPTYQSPVHSSTSHSHTKSPAQSYTQPQTQTSFKSMKPIQQTKITAFFKSMKN